MNRTDRSIHCPGSIVVGVEIGVSSCHCEEIVTDEMFNTCVPVLRMISVSVS